MVMMFAGLRRGEVLYIDIDRDVDFEKKTIITAIPYPLRTRRPIFAGMRMTMAIPIAMTTQMTDGAARALTGLPGNR